MAFSTIQRMIRAKDTLILGSAPLSPSEQQLLTQPNVLICVNGSISSTIRTPDLWILNSRDYDDPIYLNPDRWPANRKHLHERMMHQSASRHARHILFLLKNRTPDQTISRLRSQNTTWRAHTTIHLGLKTDIVRAVGVHKYLTAFNVSAGLFGACLALRCKASRVTLIGFSLKDGYAYEPQATNSRFHIDQDLEALPQLLSHHPHFHLTNSGLIDLLGSHDQ